MEDFKPKLEKWAGAQLDFVLKALGSHWRVLS